MNGKQVLNKLNDSTLKRANNILPIECKIILQREVNKLTRILNRLDNELDKRTKT
jgi:hypothetical protein